MTKKMKYERPFLRTIGEDTKQCGCATGTAAGGTRSAGLLVYCINGDLPVSTNCYSGGDATLQGACYCGDSPTAQYGCHSNGNLDTHSFYIGATCEVGYVSNDNYIFPSTTIKNSH